jgi:hypothetical protein
MIREKKCHRISVSLLYELFCVRTEKRPLGPVNSFPLVAFRCVGLSFSLSTGTAGASNERTCGEVQRGKYHWGADE